MTLGILCTVVLGAVALWQAVLAAAYRRIAADAYEKGHRDASASWRGVVAVHETGLRVLGARHDTFVEGLKRCHWPHVRHDARAMHQAIHDAAVAANRAAEAAREQADCKHTAEFE